MAADREAIESLVRSLDDDADPMHLDMTPAVSALAEIGEEAIPALLDPLASDRQLTRLHAQRALEHIVYRRHGFRPGLGFPSDSAEAAATSELVEIGYAHDDDDEPRAAAIERLRCR